jgi:hypothetical protein
MSSSDRIFKKQRIAWPGRLALSVRGLEFHLPVENEYPHSKRRWMQITDPSGRYQKETVA